jgi:glycogen operon protein
LPATSFELDCPGAIGVELLLYGAAGGTQPLRAVRLDPATTRSGTRWSVSISHVLPGARYCWRVTRSDGQFEVLDPLARVIDSANWNRVTRVAGGPLGLRGVVTPPLPTVAPVRRFADLRGAVIYELHVGGFTRHDSAGAERPGTFLALIEKLPYLQDLGITHIELMPVAAFDEQDVPAGVAALGLRNFWGYSPLALAAPHPGYGASPDPTAHPAEFQALVHACHEAGIGVLLDVVLNHTAEHGADGPLVHYKCTHPETFYHRSAAGDFHDYTGCGNTVNANQPEVVAHLVEVLTRWAREFGVDGFRFDLASALLRGPDGTPLEDPPLLRAIAAEPALCDLALIAEPWDAVALYHVGAFPDPRWHEWNGRYRDAVRRALRGDRGVRGELATCLAGSSDLYERAGRSPSTGINYVTSHDGFTLLDLFSYAEKHNEANGEDNRDGWNHNLSHNQGTEGETLDEDIRNRRAQLARTALTLLMLSQGVPMLLAGDEVLRTQRGNNNAWCQDNELGWFDWRLTTQNADQLRFTRELIALRKRHPTLTRADFLTGAIEAHRELPDIAWHDATGATPDWSDPEDRFLGFTLLGLAPGEEDLRVLINLRDTPASVPLAPMPGRHWHLAIDTARESPGEIVPRELQVPWLEPTYFSAARSVVVLEAR